MHTSSWKSDTHNLFPSLSSPEVLSSNHKKTPRPVVVLPSALLLKSSATKTKSSTFNINAFPQDEQTLPN